MACGCSAASAPAHATQRISSRLASGRWAVHTARAMTAESVVLEAAGLPSVALHPAPWQLHAQAYVIALHLPEATSDAQLFVPPSLLGKRRSRFAYAMWVDYQSSDCGPYRELLFAPAGFDCGTRNLPSITRIYVSTYDSVVNGRANWGIPKDRADFGFEHGTDNVDQITLSRDGHTFVNMRFRPRGLTLPVPSALIPASLRTLFQHWQGHSYTITLNAQANMRSAKLIDWSFDPAFFPDLSQARLLGVVQLPRVTFDFPVADIQSL
jgi:hypothetical protein